MDNVLEPHLVRRLRNAANLTQEEFAAALEVNVSQVKRWELGKAAPAPKARRKIIAFAAARGLSIAPPAPTAEVLS